MQRQREYMLVVAEGPNVGTRYPLLDMVSTLGRSSDNALVFDSSQISRHHAQIRLLPGGAVIEDMGSTNGTYVNNRRLVEPHSLSSGDRIRLADYVTLEYTVREMARTENLVPSAASGSTQVMGEPFGYASPSHSTQPYQESARAAEPQPPVYPQQPSYEEPVPLMNDSAPVLAYSEPVSPSGEASPAPRRSKGLYIVIGVLVVLICLCIALAVYLWFAPLSFWERVFDVLGIPLPSGVFARVGF